MITHWHNDHPQGISAIRDAYPRVRIIAHAPDGSGNALGPRRLDVGYAPGPKWDAAMATLLSKSREQLEELLVDPATAPDRRERIKKALAQYRRSSNGDFAGTYIVLPTETFERRAGDRRPRGSGASCCHLGRANTDGRRARLAAQAEDRRHWRYRRLADPVRLR